MSTEKPHSERTSPERAERSSAERAERSSSERAERSSSERAERAEKSSSERAERQNSERHVTERFRFLHASDLHLEQPLYGFDEAPDHLRPLLVDAPYLAAEKVFQAALLEQVDFVLLAGDVYDPHSSGPRALAFLLDQFERLRERGVAVYWAGGAVDAPEHWPALPALPPNVRFFPRGRIEEITHQRGAAALAWLQGISDDGARFRPADFKAPAPGRYGVVAAHGKSQLEAFGKLKTSYWALGGEHQRLTWTPGGQTVHYPGSPQGRCPAEAGPHGCTLVQVEKDGQTRLQFLPTDVARFRNERLKLEPNDGKAELLKHLRLRMQQFATESRERAQLVAWTLDDADKLSGQLRFGGLLEETLKTLRNDFGGGHSPVWTISLKVEPAGDLPANLYEEDTILGDFLRALRATRQSEQPLPSLAHLLTPRQAESDWAAELQLARVEDRERVLRQAATLALDFLRGESS